MNMLNYLGAAPGPGVTMPGGMPGSGAPTDPMLSPQAAFGGGGAPAPAGPPPPPPAMGGSGGMFGMPAAGMVDPAGRQYEALTQEDGSVLLHLKNPDGTRGPAVKIVPPIKPRNPGM